ncbi:MAG: hypothetical protein JEZ07_11645 [Phycisphaerae bacterium]|nr:hypothetical protein [Phycisphaerae bacterium]
MNSVTAYTTTDEQGRFCIKGVEGYELSVYLKKEGFAASEDNQTKFEKEIPIQGTCVKHPIQFMMNKNE